MLFNERAGGATRASGGKAWMDEGGGCITRFDFQFNEFFDGG